MIGPILLHPLYKPLWRKQKQNYLYICKFANIETFCCKTDQLEHKQQQVIPHPIYPLCIVGFLDMEICCSDSTHVQGQRVERPGDEGATYSRNVCYSLPVDAA